MSATKTRHEVKERPILFSGGMVRAILEGRKTQTRRVIKPQPDARPGMDCTRLLFKCRDGIRPLVDTAAEEAAFMCPYGMRGDRLWVRETFVLYEGAGSCGVCYGVCYVADEHCVEAIFQEPNEWTRQFTGTGKKLTGLDALIIDADVPKKPSIFMPRKFSRITLEITEVRVERLWDISEADAKEEGMEKQFRISVRVGGNGMDERIPTSYRGGFANGWDRINSKRGYSWESNPWVWAISFQRV